MTNTRLFDRLRAETAHLLATPAAKHRWAAWAQAEPALAGVTPTELLAHSGSAAPSRIANERVGALVRLAGHDALAERVVLAAVCPGLAAASARLARAWQAEPDEIDAAMAAAAWSRVTGLAGKTIEWPANAIVAGARAEVRASLVTTARRRRLAQTHAELPEPEPPPEDRVDAANLVADAVRRGLVSADAARLVWVTRVLGWRLAELAGPGQRVATLRVTRWRAEQALRAVA